jgi:hypothetical protein
MLTISGGDGTRFCDGVSRRDFLKIGGLALGGLALPQILAAEAQAGVRSSHKAVIMVFLAGGPPHQDMFDLKPDAPPDIRGEFKPIKTNVPGVEICEHMPRLAKMMDRCAIIRSLVGARDEHTSHISLSGYTYGEFRQGKWPCLGAVASRLQGPVDPVVPPFVSLSQKMAFPSWANPGEAGFLGRGHAAFQPHGQVADDIRLKGISLSRLQDRRRLLASVDRFHRDADARTEGVDAITQRALDMLTSSKVVQAMDVEKEDPKLRDRYGRGSLKNVDDGGPMWNDGLLISRRLVEAGVRCVTIGYGRWDYHGNNFGQCRERLPLLDQGVSALIQDLHDRGLDRDVSVVVWGDFGRTPRINKEAGRDHWPAVSTCLLAGGGMRTGQVIGSTTPDGGYADERPVDYKDVMATLYQRMGIDVRSTAVTDSLDRPHYLLEGHEPIPQLV